MTTWWYSQQKRGCRKLYKTDKSAFSTHKLSRRKKKCEGRGTLWLKETYLPITIYGLYYNPDSDKYTVKNISEIVKEMWILSGHLVILMHYTIAGRDNRIVIIFYKDNYLLKVCVET